MVRVNIRQAASFMAYSIQSVQESRPDGEFELQLLFSICSPAPNIQKRHIWLCIPLVTQRNLGHQRSWKRLQFPNILSCHSDIIAERKGNTRVIPIPMSEQPRKKYHKIAGHMAIKPAVVEEWSG